VTRSVRAKEIDMAVPDCPLKEQKALADNGKAKIESSMRCLETD
jgi:hypothetical protein